MEFSLSFPWRLQTAFGGREGYFSVAIIAFGACGFIRSKYYYRLRKWTRGIGNPLAIYRGLSGPRPPKPPKKSEEISRGLRPRGPLRVWKKSRKSFSGTFSRLFQTLETFSRLSEGLGPEGVGDFFQIFSGFRARRARETPVNGRRVPNRGIKTP